MAEPKKNDVKPSDAELDVKNTRQPDRSNEARLEEQVKQLEAKLAEKEDGRKTTRGLTPSIQALATIDTALRKLKGEDAAAVQRVVAWIAQEWLPANKVMTDKPGG